jgi:hypothetical protein
MNRSDDPSPSCSSHLKSRSLGKRQQCLVQKVLAQTGKVAVPIAIIQPEGMFTVLRFRRKEKEALEALEAREREEEFQRQREVERLNVVAESRFWESSHFVRYQLQYLG